MGTFVVTVTETGENTKAVAYLNRLEELYKAAVKNKQLGLALEIAERIKTAK